MGGWHHQCNGHVFGQASGDGELPCWLRVKSLSAMWEDPGSIPGREDPLKMEMATHSSIFAWRSPMGRGAWWAIVHGVA